MAKNKLTVNFTGFEEMIEKLDKLGGSIKKTTEEALNATYDVVEPQLEAGIKKHRLTGETERSLKPKKIIWNGNNAYINIGFDINKGGLASIFLNYGTPKMKPDPFITRAVKTKKKLYQEKQKEIFLKELNKLGG